MYINSILVHLLTAVFHAADLMLAVDLKGEARIALLRNEVYIYGGYCKKKHCETIQDCQCKQTERP